MHIKKEEYLYPMTIKIEKRICEKVYFLSFPKKIKEMLIRLEQSSNIKFNPQYNLPTNSLKKMMVSHMPGVTDMKMISAKSDDSKWLISFNEININLVVRILRVWIEAFYIDESELDKKRNNNDDVKRLAKELSKEIVIEAFEPTFSEEIVLFENGKAVDSIAYTVLPMKIVHVLTGRKISFMDEEVELFYSNRNEVITNPLIYKDKKDLDYRSYVINFSVQTLPPYNEAYLNVDISIRRWISRNESNKVPYLPIEKNCYIKVGTHKLQSIAASYSASVGTVVWKNGDYKCYNACYSQYGIPDFEEVIISPEAYMSGDIMDIYIPFQYGIDGIQHNTDNGKTFKDSEILFQVIRENIDNLNTADTSKALKISESNKPTSYFDDKFLLKNNSKFASALSNALLQQRLTIEIWYSSGQEDVREALLKILNNHMRDTNTIIQVYKLEDLDKPLQVENKKAKVNLNGFELRVQEVQRRLQASEGPILSFIILENKDSFRTEGIVEELLDPKKALRVGFAKMGRITQFITPRGYRETEQRNKIEIEKYNKRVQAFEKGELDKKPRALGKNYYINTNVQHAILDGYRQLGVLCDVSKNKDLMGKKVTGIYVCNYKNTIYGKSIQSFPILITCDFEKGCISAFCDLIEQVDIPYWKFLLGMSNLTSKVEMGTSRSIKSSATVLTRRISRLIAKGEEHILVITADGTSRKLIKGIANTEIAEAVDVEKEQVTKLYINDELNGTIDLSKVDNLSIVRLRVNDEVPDYYPTKSEKNSKNYKSMSGVFQFKQVYYSLDAKSSSEKDTLKGDHSKVDKDQRYSHRNLVEIYPLFTSDKSEETIISVMKAVHDLREAALQYESGKTILPLPLHLAKKVEEYII